jgi:hypothetical protein
MWATPAFHEKGIRSRILASEFEAYGLELGEIQVREVAGKKRLGLRVGFKAWNLLLSHKAETDCRVSPRSARGLTL